MKYVTDYQKYWNYYGFLRDKMSAASMKTATFITAEAVEFLRDKQILEIKEQINKIPNKISIISVIFVLPIILLLILGPIFINFLG